MREELSYRGGNRWYKNNKSMKFRKIFRTRKAWMGKSIERTKKNVFRMYNDSAR